jgi:hypothetical protein
MEEDEIAIPPSTVVHFQGLAELSKLTLQGGTHTYVPRNANFTGPVPGGPLSQTTRRRRCVNVSGCRRPAATVGTVSRLRGARGPTGTLEVFCFSTAVTESHDGAGETP